MQPRCQPRALCAVEFKQSGTRCAFICGLIAVCCTKRIASIFKDLELKNSIYVRYAFSVDDYTLGVFLEKGLPSAQLPVAWADNQGFRRQHHQGTSWALEFRSQDSKLKSIWETVLKRCFSLFGLCLNDPRLRGLGSQDHRPEAWMLGTFGGLSQYPKVWQPRSCPEERSLAPVPLT